MSVKGFIIPFLIVISTFCVLNAEVIKTPASDVDKWFSRGVFYELFVRSFKDTDGDKHGDFKGIIEKMDYIEKLGVSALWLMPINDSFEHTNNYDSVNFMDVDPTYGSLDDFKKLLEESHKRGVKVILDLVLNHTSNKHPFFIDASTNKKSKYRNWYVFNETKPEGKWTNSWHESPTGYYYAYFVDSKPDFNYKNPEVVEYMKNVMRFWLDMGVDGFRFDAVTLLVENGDENVKHQKESYDVYRNLRKFIDEEYKERDIFTIAESEAPYKSYLGNGNDMFNAVFNFKSNGTIIRMVKNNKPFTDKGVSLVESLAKNYSNELKDISGAFYGNLLSNHDLYAGSRPFRQFDGDIGKTKLAGAILLTMPGIPFVYYGEEIALDTYTRSKSDRWLRNCMIWDDTKNNGFTSAEKSWTMINAGDEAVNKLFNVSVQENDKNSILNNYRRLIKARKENIALSLGDYEQLDSKNILVSSYLRKHNDNKIVVIHNFSDKNQKANIVVNNINESAIIAEELTESETKFSYKAGVIKIIKLLPYETMLIKLK